MFWSDERGWQAVTTAFEAQLFLPVWAPGGGGARKEQSADSSLCSWGWGAAGGGRGGNSGHQSIYRETTPPSPGSEQVSGRCHPQLCHPARSSVQSASARTQGPGPCYQGRSCDQSPRRGPSPSWSSEGGLRRLRNAPLPPGTPRQLFPSLCWPSQRDPPGQRQMTLSEAQSRPSGARL